MLPDPTRPTTTLLYGNFGVVDGAPALLLYRRWVSPLQLFTPNPNRKPEDSLQGDAKKI